MASEAGGRVPAMPPTYPGFDVMDEQLAWDPVTRAIVAARLHPSPPRALGEAEARTLTAAARRLLAEERPEVLAFVVAHVDARLLSGAGEGQREATAPPEADLLRRGLAALDRAAGGGAAAFADLTADRQDQMLGALAQGRAEPGGAFAGLPQKALLQKLLDLAAEALASHPAVWSEIGYAGPAYPRGYYRMGRGVLDPWEPRAQPGGRRRDSARDRRARGDGQADGPGQPGAQFSGHGDGRRETGGDTQGDGSGRVQIRGRGDGPPDAQRPGGHKRPDGEPLDSRQPAGDSTSVRNRHAASEAPRHDLPDLNRASGQAGRGIPPAGRGTDTVGEAEHPYVGTHDEAHRGTQDTPPGEAARRRCDHYAGHRLDHLGRRKFGDEEVDVCIVGAGAAGGVLAQRLARAGMRAVVVEAGPFWEPASDFASDELTMRHLGWQETRLVGGTDPLQLGHNTCGRGVGGGTTHFTGVFLRFHANDFRTRSLEGVGVDWPLAYHDLDFHYRQVEHEVAVAGPLRFPWGEYRGPYPQPARAAVSPNAQVFARGCAALGITSCLPPLAILSAPHAGRPPCINRGFCNQGCTPNSKFSTLIQHIPQAIAAGAEVLSDCMVTQVEVGRDGAVTGVLFRHGGREHRQRARAVILANFVVETPRLLLQCTGPGHEDGLANGSGMVGKCIMVHAAHDVYAAMDEEVRLYKGTPVLATTQDFYETDPGRGFARGYTLHAHGARPVELAGGLCRAGLWGQPLREALREYNYLARITMVGEVLPDERNRVRLADERDAHGMRRALVEFSFGDNDRRLIDHAVGRARAILEAAGGTPRHVVPDTAHLLGGCRMGDDPATSVVDRDCRCHDVPNLYICSGAVFPTSSGGNPTETIMALASRTAARLLERARHHELAGAGIQAL